LQNEQSAAEKKNYSERCNQPPVKTQIGDFLAAMPGNQSFQHDLFLSVRQDLARQRLFNKKFNNGPSPA